MNDVLKKSLKKIFPVLALLSVAPEAAWAADFGVQPPAEFPFTPSTDFSLPALHLGAADQAGIVARGTQVFQRAQAEGINSTTADQAWHGAADTIASDRAIGADVNAKPLRLVNFTRTTFSALARVLAAAGSAHVVVVSRVLNADVPLIITGKNIVVDFSGATVSADPAKLTWIIPFVRQSDR